MNLYFAAQDRSWAATVPSRMSRTTDPITKLMELARSRKPKPLASSSPYTCGVPLVIVAHAANRYGTAPIATPPRVMFPPASVAAPAVSSSEMIGRPAITVREFVPRHAGIIDADNETPPGRPVSATTNNLARGRRLGTRRLAAPDHFASRQHRL